LQRLKLPPCRTRNTDLPGAWGIERAREALQAIESLSVAGTERLLGIYGGRAAEVAELCTGELAHALDEDGRMLAAEVIFVIREEFALTLEDIVFRRMMIGLDPDQGRPQYDEIAAIAAMEAGWSPEQKAQQLDAVIEYAESLRVR
jgi:glycerol-3-phosphate dehydrogenase